MNNVKMGIFHFENYSFDLVKNNGITHVDEYVGLVKLLRLNLWIFSYRKILKKHQKIIRYLYINEKL